MVMFMLWNVSASGLFYNNVVCDVIDGLFQCFG